MRALVTNDDGIAAPGLRALARAARDGGLDVVVAAPAEQASGSSASIARTGRRMEIETRHLDDLDDLPVFAVDGGPGLVALMAAHGAFGDAPDIVLSGVNHGANVGRAILHSGTVGAALTGGLHGAWGIAVSLDVGEDPDQGHWDVAASVAMELLPVVSAQAHGTVVNVNVPDAPSSHGMHEAALAPLGVTRTALDGPRGDPDSGTDAALLSHGWITITAIDPVSDAPLGLMADRGTGFIRRSSGDDPLSPEQIAGLIIPEDI